MGIVPLRLQKLLFVVNTEFNGEHQPDAGFFAGIDGPAQNFEIPDPLWINIELLGTDPGQNFLVFLQVKFDFMQPDSHDNLSYTGHSAGTSDRKSLFANSFRPRGSKGRNG